MAGKMSLEFFSKKGYQLYFIARLKTTFTTLGAVYRELFAENGTTLMYNIPTPIYTPQTINTLNAMKNQLANTFMNDDFTYPTVDGEGCSIFAKLFIFSQLLFSVIRTVTIIFRIRL